MSLWRFFKFGQSAALNNRYGRQINVPAETLIDSVRATGVDGALQISTVWRAVEIISKTIATLPIMVYTNKNGIRSHARNEILWEILHERPNLRQTPAEFWIALLLNFLLRGNGYAEITRNGLGKAIKLTVIPADYVQFEVKENGDDVYVVNTGSSARYVNAIDMLHIKEMTGGYVGMSRLEYMRATMTESSNCQSAANGLFSSGGKISGILSPATTMTSVQWDQLQDRVDQMVKNPRQIQVLPGDLKLSQINLTPEDIQLLTTRQFTVQEIGRWFGVPAILLNQTEGTTTLGSSSADIISSFEKLTLRPIVICIEQAIRHRVMSPSERSSLDVEFNLDGLLRASLADRMEIYSKGVQNGIYSRNESRRLENMPPYEGGDTYTAQSNLMPVDKLGSQAANSGNVPNAPVKQ